MGVREAKERLIETKEWLRCAKQKAERLDATNLNRMVLETVEHEANKAFDQLAAAINDEAAASFAAEMNRTRPDALEVRLAKQEVAKTVQQRMDESMGWLLCAQQKLEQPDSTNLDRLVLEAAKLEADKALDQLQAHIANQYERE